MYQDQSRWSSTISRYFGLTFTNLFLVFFLFFCSQLSLASAQTNTSENLQGQCHFKIQSIEKVKDPANSSIPPTIGWITTILPDNWTKEKNWQFYSGAVWYKIIWDRHCENASAQKQPIFLSISRIILAGEVFNNAEPIWRDESLIEPYSRSFSTPRYFTFPASTIQEKQNVTLIKVHGDYSLAPGLGEIKIGLQDQVIPFYLERIWNQRTLYQINFTISLIFSILFFFVWLLNRKEVAYGWFALASLCWLVFLCNWLMTSAYPFSNSNMPDRINTIALLWHGYFFCLFTWRFASKHYLKTERIFIISNILLSIYILFTPLQYLLNTKVIYIAIYFLIFLFNCIFMQWIAYKTPKFEVRVLAFVMFIFILISINDIYHASHAEYEKMLAPYSSPILTIALSLVLSWRIHKNMQQIRKFNETLKVTIEQVTDDLKLSLEKKYQLEVENMRLQERLNLSHELHDGLGGSLVRSMILVDKNEELDRSHFLSILKLLRSDLRQIIDTGANVDMEAPKTPILWGAPLRHRFIQIFEELDIDSDWTFAEKWGKAPTTQQCLTLSRVAEEALTNVIKHSRATHVSVSMLENRKGQLVLQIRDNGVGFDPSTVQEGLHVGLQSMQARVNRIGGEFIMISRQGETILQVIL